MELVASIIGCLQKTPCLGKPLEEKYNFFTKHKEYLDTLKNGMVDLEKRRCEVERESEEKVVSKPYKISDWLKKANEFIAETK